MLQTMKKAGVMFAVALSMACGTPEPTANDELCNEYCETMATVCQGPTQVFANDAECFETCIGYNFTGEDGDQTGDTFQCRRYHLDNAKADAVIHCPHAAPGGGGVCVANIETPCGSYCALISERCDGAEATQQYATEGDCMNACLGFKTNGQIGDTTGNTTQCRQTLLNDENLTPVEQCAEAGAESTGCVDE